MATHQTTTYQHVLDQAKDLALGDKLRLLETLAAQLRNDFAPPKHRSAREFRGTGHAAWDGTDAQEYVNRERDAWDG
jgi:hypothetical protein